MTYFARPVNKGQLIATGTIVAPTNSQIISESIVMNIDKKIVAKGSGVFVRSSYAFSDLGLTKAF